MYTHKYTHKHEGGNQESDLQQSCQQLKRVRYQIIHIVLKNSLSAGNKLLFHELRAFLDIGSHANEGSETFKKPMIKSWYFRILGYLISQISNDQKSQNTNRK